MSAELGGVFARSVDDLNAAPAPLGGERACCGSYDPGPGELFASRLAWCSLSFCACSAALSVGLFFFIGDGGIAKDRWSRARALAALRPSRASPRSLHRATQVCRDGEIQLYREPNWLARPARHPYRGVA